MITPVEACQYVQKEIPELGNTIKKDSDIFTTLTAVQEYALEKAREQNYSRLKQCFTLAASLYETGSSVVKCAVENIFVFSISRLRSETPETNRRIKALIPDSLHHIYMAQVLHHGY